MTVRELSPGTSGSRLPRRAGRRLPGVLRPPRLREAAVVALPALAVLVLGYHQRWVGDDGMIYARTVRQLLAGHGPVFNVGERAEASTGTAWQWLVAGGAYLTGRDPSVVAVTLGIALTGAGYAVATAAARRAVRPLTAAPLVPLGMLVLPAVKADWDYASSGLENGLSTGWIALAWWCLVAARTATGGRRGYAIAAVIGLGPLVRPELGLVSAVFLAALWRIVRPGLRRGPLLLGAAAAVPAGYEVFRAGYYGVLVPLPALTKEASQAVWTRGLAYFGNFAEPYRLWIPLLVLAPLGGWAVWTRRAAGRPVAGGTVGTVGALGAAGAAVTPYRRAVRACAVRPELVAPPVAGLLSWLYVIRVGGDFMHGRLLVPGLLLLMLPLCAVPLSRPVAAAGGALLVWGVCCALLWRPAESSGYPYTILDEQRSYVSYTGDPHPITEAVHGLRPRPFRPAVLAAEASGRRVLLVESPHAAGGFAALPLGRHVPARLAGAWGLLGNNGIVMPLDGVSVDTLGLAYPLVAHQARTAARTAGRSGHEKPVDPAWIVADYTDPGAAPPDGVDPARVAAARHALGCGPLAELQASVREPMTAGRFWRNLRGAWTRTVFRYPADPVAAEKALCRS